MSGRITNWIMVMHDSSEDFFYFLRIIAVNNLFLSEYKWALGTERSRAVRHGQLQRCGTPWSRLFKVGLDPTRGLVSPFYLHGPHAFFFSLGLRVELFNMGYQQEWCIDVCGRAAQAAIFRGPPFLFSLLEVWQWLKICPRCNNKVLFQFHIHHVYIFVLFCNGPRIWDLEEKLSCTCGSINTK